ncbi:HAD family hydrolase [Streptococcus caviae]|uniref:HAD family hydrolase n=1 Tax=Streptococcus sp. 'caviae' TaxID=1915004 RepID=UPI00094B9E9A|nr:HAD family hydrolase [Streptococcus sp. 'caviae']OLN84288.1 haloacid dehalogenase [Streptococcus sp. 'caviae']
MEKVIIFDMDGVIVDSEYTFFETKTQILRDEGIDADESHQYQYMGTTFEFMWQQMKDEFNLPKSVAEYIADMNARRDALMARDGVRPIKGVKTLIHWLKDHGYRLAVASSSPLQEIKRALTELELADCFDYMVTSEEVPRSKPAPDVFLYAAQLLQAQPADCIVIEDTKNGTRAAKAANMYCFGFANPDYPAQDLSAADQLITDYSDLYQYLKD